MKSLWRKLRRPSRQTLQQLESNGAKVDYWPDYAPRRRAGSARHILSISREEAEAFYNLL